MLTADELAQLRTTAAEFLPDSAILKRRALTDDGNGGQAASYSTVGTYPCRLVFSGGKSESGRPGRIEGGKPTADSLYLVTLKYDVEALETDRLTINSNTYEIISATTARSHEVTKRLLVKRI